MPPATPPAGPNGARGRTLQLDVKDGLFAALQVVVVGLQHGLPIDLRATPRRQVHHMWRAGAAPAPLACRRSDTAEAAARTMMTRFLTARVLRRTLTPPLSAAASARAASSAAAASLAVIASMFACPQHARRSHSEAAHRGRPDGSAGHADVQAGCARPQPCTDAPQWWRPRRPVAPDWAAAGAPHRLHDGVRRRLPLVLVGLVVAALALLMRPRHERAAAQAPALPQRIQGSRALRCGSLVPRRTQACVVSRATTSGEGLPDGRCGGTTGTRQHTAAPLHTRHTRPSRLLQPPPEPACRGTARLRRRVGERAAVRAGRQPRVRRPRARAGRHAAEVRMLRHRELLLRVQHALRMRRRLLLLLHLAQVHLRGRAACQPRHSVSGDR
jgi:hypothetical protein